MQALGVHRPESVRIGKRALIHLLVLGVVDVGATFPFRRDLVDFLRHLFPPHASSHYATPSRAATRLGTPPTRGTRRKALPSRLENPLKFEMMACPSGRT